MIFVEIQNKIQIKKKRLYLKSTETRTLLRFNWENPEVDILLRINNCE